MSFLLVRFRKVLAVGKGEEDKARVWSSWREWD